MRWKRWLAWSAGSVMILVPVLAGVGLWAASSQLLFPAWKGATHDFAVCPPDLAAAWGEGCGNLRLTRDLAFDEVSVPSSNGYEMPGWLIRAGANGRLAGDAAILLVHGGGSDRREETRRAPFFLDRGMDVLTVDLGCSGEAPCPVPGLSYGERESRDVLAGYLWLAARYPRVLVMGSSVGAASVLVALPAMPRLAGAIVENPIASFPRLILETPASRGVPSWFTALLVEVTTIRGRFDALASAEHAVVLGGSVPLLFIHGKQDELVPCQQSRELAERYAGPKATWWPERGGHSRLWDADRAVWEARVDVFLSSVRDARGAASEDSLRGPPR
jgi:uncharacterized protein